MRFLAVCVLLASFASPSTAAVELSGEVFCREDSAEYRLASYALLLLHTYPALSETHETGSYSFALLDGEPDDGQEIELYVLRPGCVTEDRLADIVDETSCLDVSAIENCYIGSQNRRFRTRELDRKTGEIARPAIHVDELCGSVENEPVALALQLGALEAKLEHCEPGGALRKKAIARVAGGVLSLLSGLAPFLELSAIPIFRPPPAIFPVGLVVRSVPAESLSSGGNFDFESILLGGLSQNLGFNLAPGGDLGEATFWNASATALARKGQIGARADGAIELMSQSSFVIPVGQRASVSLGFQELRVEDQLSVVWAEDPRFGETTEVEHRTEALYLAGAVRVGDRWSVGATLKRLVQKAESPTGLSVAFDDGEPRFATDLFVEDRRVEELDFDLSASVDFNSRTRFGVSLMNVLGTEIFDLEGVPVNLRTLAAGVRRDFRRVNIGTDLSLQESGRGDVAVGLELFATSRMTLRAGGSLRYSGVTVGFDYGWLTSSWNHNEITRTTTFVGVRYRLRRPPGPAARAASSP